MWINEDVLQGEAVILEPLTLEDTDAYIKVSEDGDVWKLWYTTVPKP